MKQELPEKIYTGQGATTPPKPEAPVQINIEPQVRSEDEDAITVSVQKRW